MRRIVLLLLVIFSISLNRAAAAVVEPPEGSANANPDNSRSTTQIRPVTTGTVLQGHVVRPVAASSGVTGIFDMSDNPTVATPEKKASLLKLAAITSKSLANFALDLRGFDFSKEGANAVLDEKIRVNSELAKEYIMRKEIDARELTVVSTVMKLADSIHSASANALRQQSDAVETLQQELSDAEVQSIYQRLFDLELSNSATHFGESWDLCERDEKSKEIFEAAVNADPEIKLLKDKLHAYNNRSKLMQMSAKAIYSALGIAACAPTLVAPLAEVSMLTFMMATGGPEQDKLLKEVYLSKCLESRYRVIAEKTNLVSACQSRAVFTKNQTLMACTTELLRQMTSDVVVNSVFAKSGSQLCRGTLSSSPEASMQTR